MNDLTAGCLFDSRYSIIEHLSDGGMGQLFKAKDELDRLVALKLLHPSLLTDREARTRFSKEAEIMTRLQHSHLVKLYRFGFQQSLYPYLAMEFLDGSDLRQLLRREGQLSIERSFKIALQICEALSVVHKEGVVHRDLKPENVMLLDKPEPDYVKVVDFGLARSLQSSSKSVVVQQLTQSGLLIGSVHYMSPEQCEGQKADKRSDIYALGCLLYECVTGKRPFDGDNPVAILSKHVNDSPASLSADVAGPQTYLVQALISKAMHKQPDKRYQSMNDFAADIVHFLQGDYHSISAKTVDTEPGRKTSHRALLSLSIVALLVVTFLCLRHSLHSADVLPLSSDVARTHQIRRLGDNSLSSRMRTVRQMYQMQNPDAFHELTKVAALLKHQKDLSDIEPADLYFVFCVMANSSLMTDPARSVRCIDQLIAALQRKDDEEYLLKAKTRKAEIILNRGGVFEAERLLNEVLQELSHRDKSDEDYLFACTSLATCYRIERRDQEAESLYIRTTSMARSSAVKFVVLANLGDFYIEQKRFKEAKQSYEDCLKQKPQIASAATLYYKLGIACSSLSQAMEARSNFAKAQELVAPNTDESMRICLAIVQYGVASNQPSQMSLTDWLRHNSDLSLQARLIGSLSGTEPCAREACRLVVHRLQQEGMKDVDSADLCAMLQNICVKSLFEPTFPLLNKASDLLALRADHYHLAVLKYTKASLLFKQGKFAEAEPLLRQVLEEATHSNDFRPTVAKAQLYTELAKCCWVNRKTKDAEQFYKEACKACAAESPAQYEALETLGDLYLEYGRGREAIETFKRLVSFKNLPDDTSIRTLLKLAQAQGLCGNHKEARDAIARARSHSSSTLEQKAALDIAEIRQLTMEGKIDRAKVELELWLRNNPQVNWNTRLTALSILRRAYVASGDTAAGLSYLDREIAIARANASSIPSLCADLESLRVKLSSRQ